MSPPPLTISVVICTKDRRDGLIAALDHYRPWLGQPGWNLLVVDDGSSDGTGAALADRTASFGQRISVRRTSGIGLGAARNLGWRSADGEVVLFTDDDCYPAPDLLDQLRRGFSDSSVAFLGGRLLPYTPEDGRVAVVTRETASRLAAPMFVAAGLLPGANLAVRRTALELVGGFDDEFGAGTPFPAEDVELVARLVAAGCQGWYDPRLVVFHHHGRRGDAAERALLLSYDAGRGAYYAKCLGDARLRSRYLRAWFRSAWKGSWPRTWRELAGAVRYWTRPRRPRLTPSPTDRSP